MTRFIASFGAVAVLACLPVTTQAQWSEGFEDYVVGSGMHGQGGWEGWTGDPTWDAFVSDAQAHGGSQSVDIVGDADLVHMYCGVTFGQWTYTAWQYVPAGLAGQSYFILLNKYPSNPNWSLQLRFDSDIGMVESEFEAAQLPLITDQWVEIRVEIDLVGDTQSIYYGGELLSTKSWTEGLSGGGLLKIRAVDLFANGATTVYYDDISLAPACVGDLDGSGSVDLSDLAAMLANYATTSGMCYDDGDMDFDRDVDLSDLAALLGNYGPC
jgi:hypothetical protein